MEKSDKFERMALQLAALNLAFESARRTGSGGEFLKMSEQIDEMVMAGIEPDSSD
jgi:hypothetical protein